LEISLELIVIPGTRSHNQPPGMPTICRFFRKLNDRNVPSWKSYLRLIERQLNRKPTLKFHSQAAVFDPKRAQIYAERMQNFRIDIALRGS
jgi:hypothetical protein